MYVIEIGFRIIRKLLCVFMDSKWKKKSDLKLKDSKTKKKTCRNNKSV